MTSESLIVKDFVENQFTWLDSGPAGGILLLKIEFIE